MIWKVVRWIALVLVIASFFWQIAHGICPVP
jgi:hypothetical protein